MPSNRPKNLLVLKLPRTGSTYLAHILRQHPGITIHHEYLNRHSERRARLMRGPLGIPLVRRVTGKALQYAKWHDLGQLLDTSNSAQIVGATLNPFKERITAANLRSVVNAGTRIMILARDNLLKQHISHLNVLAEQEAGAERPYKSYSDSGAVTDRKFHVTSDAIAKIEQLDRQRQELFQIVSDLDVPQLHLTYEKHINVSDKTPLLTAVAEFLEIDHPEEWGYDERPAADAPRYHKLVSDDLQKVIANYDEVAENPAMAKFLA